MKDFVVRLGLVIHWFGFILGFIAFGGLMVGGFMEEGSDDVAMTYCYCCCQGGGGRSSASSANVTVLSGFEYYYYFS